VKISDTQLDIVPGATGERHRFVGIGTEVRARLGLLPGGVACLLPRDDAGRIVRGVDPHVWAPVTEGGKGFPSGPWLKCQRCGVYSRPEGYRA
jgi:hypothetical protein